MNFKLDGEFVYKDEPNTCKGVFFRGYYNKYMDAKGFHEKSGFRLLKRKSCSGCDKCGFLLESMNEVPDAVIFPKDINDGALYTVKVVNESRDWETGYIDDYDIKFYEVKDETKNDKK